MHKTAIWWIRRDLRLHDNQALLAAQGAAELVIPTFILDPALLNSPYVGSKRLAFLFANLRALDASLRQRSSRLLVLRGDPVQELANLLRRSQAGAVFCEPDYSPYACRRDRRAAQNLPVTWCGSPAIQPPGIVVKSGGQPYVVFTPFSRAWKNLPRPCLASLTEAPQEIRTPVGLADAEIPETPRQISSLFPAGEEQARRRLEEFFSADGQAIYQYSRGRDRLDLEGTSRLSPYLRFGLLSPRLAAARAWEAIDAAPDMNARQGAETWLNELIWRDFYIHILYHFPRLRRENFRLPGIRWHNDAAQFEAWTSGLTGYPLVDAAMRQLASQGWMHNRARMIVASFLTKDLLVDWRWGERWFMQHLLDGDPAVNNGGWQWTAGTGTDAAPYFRIFNPVSQSKTHDPGGEFIRRWVPELVDVPGEYIHEPWLMPAAVQVRAGCVIGVDYPAPIVEHGIARQRALEAYGQA